MQTVEAKDKQRHLAEGLARSLAPYATGSKATLLMKLAETLTRAQALTAVFSEEQLTGRAESYSRELLYAHPEGLFSVMLLSWRKGQHSPVHGHWTWCGYVILKGELSEQIYRWENGAPRYEFERPHYVGDVVVSDAGHGDVHRLGNNVDETAISLHIYGVDREHIATHINRVFKD